MTPLLWLALLLAGPARAQIRVAAPEVRLAPAVSPVLAAPALPTPSLFTAAPLAASLPVSAVPAASPSPIQAAPPLAAMAAHAESAAASFDGGSARPAAPGDAPPATAAELDFAAGAGSDLGRRADDLGEARGQKAGRMSGADFISLVEDARRAADAEPAPSPAAARAASAVRASLARVVRALTAEDKPLSDGLRRTLSVWQVFDQEMAVAAGRGTLEGISAEAALFASQVEQSVEPPPTLAPAAPHPEDPEGYATVAVPGSVFGWQPIETSPGHGLAPVDALIRRVLSDRQDPARAEGFELAGAPRRQDARIFFYGERHTDGGLIAANMARLVEDAKPGAPLIVLVEGYTGWLMRGYAALKYLADRGLDPDALAAKDVASAQVEVRGWDTIDGYGASKHPLLQHHMELLELNRLAHGPDRGWRYYRDFARAAFAAVRGWTELWKVAIIARNSDLDRAVAKAAEDAAASGATVHVIAGSDHLVQNPRLGAFFPRLAKPSFRASLAAALGGRPYWASRPAETRSGS